MATPVPAIPPDPTTTALAAAQALVAALESQQAAAAIIANHPVQSRWLKAHEVGAILGLSSRTVYRLINRGVLPAIRVETAVRVDEGDLREWMARQRLPGAGVVPLRSAPRRTARAG
jgi:excisionase family DNA binding protein